MPLLMIMIAGLAVGVFFGMRYSELDRTIDANKAQMARNLGNQPDSSVNPSIRIAKAVERDEQLFDDTLLATAAKRTAGLISIFGLCVAILAITLVGSGDLERKKSGKPMR
jgi:hypothetical protein